MNTITADVGIMRMLFGLGALVFSLIGATHGDNKIGWRAVAMSGIMLTGFVMLTWVTK